METIFEKSNGADGVGFSVSDEIKLEGLIPADLLRKDPVGLPQLSELEVLRHYKELSDRNFCIEKGFYPLGSCTMKYNPKVNEPSSVSEITYAPSGFGSFTFSVFSRISPCCGNIIESIAISIIPVKIVAIKV